jgi:hypothetical protein
MGLKGYVEQLLSSTLTDHQQNHTSKQITTKKQSQKHKINFRVHRCTHSSNINANTSQNVNAHGFKEPISWQDKQGAQMIYETICRTRHFGKGQLGGKGRKNIVSAVAISGVFDNSILFRHLLQPHCYLYNYANTRAYNAHSQSSIPLLSLAMDTEETNLRQRMRNCNSLVEMHNVCLIPLVQDIYPDTTSHYESVAFMAHSLIPFINAPVLSFSARDDPLCVEEAYLPCRRQLLKSKHAIVLETDQGGHCGFFEGFSISAFCDPITMQFFQITSHAKP